MTRWRVGVSVMAAALWLVAWVPAVPRSDALLSASSMSDRSTLAADTVGSGNQPTATGLGSQSVAVSWAASTMGSGAAVDGYIVQRLPSSGGTAVVAGGSCGGLVTTLSCTETGVPQGTWVYVITAYRAGWMGPTGANSAVVTVGQYVTVQFPADGGAYTRTDWASAHGTCPASSICGTAGTDVGSVTEVAISLRNNTTGQCWDGGAKFNQACPTYVVATGTTSWSRSVPAGRLDIGNSYTVSVRITDGAGTTVYGGPTFTITG